MKIPWNDVRRQNKAFARQLGMGFSPRKSALLLPGNVAVELAVGEQCGFFTRETCFYVAEHHPEYARQLKQVLNIAGWTPNCVLHEGGLHTMKLSQPLDYAHIDLNGTIGADIGGWMATEFSKQLTPGAVVCLTQEFCWRNNQWIKKIRQQIIDNHLSFYNDFRYYYSLYGKDYMAKYICFPPFMVCSLLRDWKVVPLPPFRYFDTIDMVLFRFIVKDREPCPVFPHLNVGRRVTLEAS